MSENEVSDETAKEEIKGIFRNHKEFFWEKIPELTGTEWRISKDSLDLRFYSDRNYWTNSEENILSGLDGIGRILRKNKILCLIIHEAIHINTSNLWGDIKFDSKKGLAREIATDTITNRLIGTINETSDESHSEIKFAPEYSDYEKFEEEIDGMYEEKGNFQDFVKAIKQRYLDKEDK